MYKLTPLFLLISTILCVHSRRLLRNYTYDYDFHQRYVRNVNGAPVQKPQVPSSNPSIGNIAAEDGIQPKIIPGRLDENVVKHTAEESVRAAHPEVRVMEKNAEESASDKGILSNVLDSGQKTLDMLRNAPIVSQVVSRIVQRDTKPIPSPDADLADLYNRTNELVNDLNDERTLLALSHEDNSDNLKYAVSLIQYFNLLLFRNYYNNNSTDAPGALAKAINQVAAKKDNTAVQFAAPFIRAGDVYRSIISLPVEIIQTACTVDTPNDLCYYNYIRMLSTHNNNDPCNIGRAAQSRIFELNLKFYSNKQTKSAPMIWNLYKRIFLKLKSKVNFMKRKRSVSSNNNVANNVNQGSAVKAPVNAPSNVQSKNPVPNAVQANAANNLQTDKPMVDKSQKKSAQNNMQAANLQTSAPISARGGNVVSNNANSAPSNVNAASNNANTAINNANAALSNGSAAASNLNTAASNLNAATSNGNTAPINANAAKTNVNAVNNGLLNSVPSNAAPALDARSLGPNNDQVVNSVAGKNAVQSANVGSEAGSNVGSNDESNIGLDARSNPEPETPSKSSEVYLSSRFLRKEVFTQSMMFNFVLSELKKLNTNNFVLDDAYEVYKYIADVQKNGTMICNTLHADNILDEPVVASNSQLQTNTI